MALIGQNASLTDWIAPRANRIYDGSSEDRAGLVCVVRYLLIPV